MHWRSVVKISVFCLGLLLCGAAKAAASQYRGVVTFGGLPLPGATIAATHGTTKLTVVSDADGVYKFDDLKDGQWTIEIEMQCFETIHTEVTIAPNMPAAAWELKLLPIDQLTAESQTAQPAQGLPQAPAPKTPEAQKPAQAGVPTEIPKAPEENEQSADGFLVQGSVNNAATSQYATNPAFGNTRSGSRGLYTGGVVVGEENSALNARHIRSAASSRRSRLSTTSRAWLCCRGRSTFRTFCRADQLFFLTYQWIAQQQLSDRYRPCADAAINERQPGRTDECAGAAGNDLQSGRPARRIPAIRFP